MKKKDNLNLAIAIMALFFSMLILSFASVPLYNLFCKATGFGGTVRQESNFKKVKKGNRIIKIEFDSNVDPNLPWRFIPKQRNMEIKTGENNLIFYESENLSDRDIIGTSVYNITPMKAAKYFVKIHCFCFEEQLLKAHQKLLMPVSFYIDPALDDDPYMDDVNIITLSYSFYKVRDLTQD